MTGREETEDGIQEEQLAGKDPAGRDRPGDGALQFQPGAHRAGRVHGARFLPDRQRTRLAAGRERRAHDPGGAPRGDLPAHAGGPGQPLPGAEGPRSGRRRRDRPPCPRPEGRRGDRPGRQIPPLREAGLRRALPLRAVGRQRRESSGWSGATPRRWSSR